MERHRVGGVIDAFASHRVGGSTQENITITSWSCIIYLKE
jgi:hypothetical protein